MTSYDLRKTDDFKKMQDDLQIMPLINEHLKSLDVTPLFAAVNGAHLWGLQSPDSDVDVHGIYLKPTTKVLSIHPGDDVIQANIDTGPGLPVIEIQFFELQKVFNMLLNNNGNLVTMIKSPFVLYPGDNELGPEFWPTIASTFITKNLKHYFKGYAFSQKKRALSSRGGKALIYTYREMFSGLHLMKFGTFEFAFERLLEVARNEGWYPVPVGNHGLLYKYYKPETGNVTGQVDTNDWNEFFIEWDLLGETLDKVAETSMLPESVDAYRVCNDVLLAYRMMDSWARL